MWENITQKDFESYLKLYENVEVFSRSNMREKGLNKILDILFKYANEKTQIFKLICEQYSNEIAENDSNKVSYYKRNNIIIALTTEYDIFEEDYVYTLLAYELKMWGVKWIINYSNKLKQSSDKDEKRILIFL